GVPVEAPPLDNTEVGDAGGSGEGAVTVAQGDIHTVVPEADNVGAAIAGDIGQEPGVLVHAPPLVNTESRDAGGHGERAVTVAQGDIHTVVPEADNVGAAIPGDIAQHPPVPLPPPPPPHPTSPAPPRPAPP